jgi:hypothetical protein
MSIMPDIYKTYPCYAVCPRPVCAESCPGYVECKLDKKLFSEKFHQKEGY